MRSEKNDLVCGVERGPGGDLELSKQVGAGEPPKALPDVLRHESGPGGK